jgi:hypothetical protein
MQKKEAFGLVQKKSLIRNWCAYHEKDKKCS